MKILNAIIATSMNEKDEYLGPSSLYLTTIFLNVMQNSDGNRRELDQFISSLETQEFNLENFKKILLKRFDLRDKANYLKDFFEGIPEKDLYETTAIKPASNQRALNTQIDELPSDLRTQNKSSFSKKCIKTGLGAAMGAIVTTGLTTAAAGASVYLITGALTITILAGVFSGPVGWIALAAAALIGLSAGALIGNALATPRENQPNPNRSNAAAYSTAKTLSNPQIKRGISVNTFEYFLEAKRGSGPS